MMKNLQRALLRQSGGAEMSPERCIAEKVNPKREDEGFAAGFTAVERSSRDASEANSYALTRGHCLVCAFRVGKSAKTSDFRA